MGSSLLFTRRDSLQPKQLVTVPPIDLNYQLQMDAGAAAQFEALGKFSKHVSNYAIFQTTNKERIKNYRIRQGSFNVNVVSEFNHNATLVFYYPTITKNGVPLMDTMIFTAPGTISKVITLDGYDVDLSDGGISYNVIPYLFEINLVRKSFKAGINQ